MLSIDELNDIHLDVLREIGNIGAGNAATSLSQMLNAEVNMSVPKVRILDISDAATALGGPENPVIGILAKISGDIEGLMMFIVGQSFAGSVLEALLGEKQVSYAALTEMQLSAISEIGNIMISAYLGSISTLSQMVIKSSVPAIAVDMAGALLSVPAIEMRTVSDKIIFIQEDFISSANDITSNMMLIPSMDSLNRLMQKLGIQL
ncbi:MAG: chemotaxis protein CheC [Clostridium sp.]|uniref:chemotaxis protein CheC n=1 Tax=Clostridium sp. TaxID=1506 RepID=UPI00290F0183|nr:chemotaxis protein CheC [Clostridium sp.]MDU7337011.1 chemotaxis protein CheC [Clostridium sp.]